VSSRKPSRTARKNRHPRPERRAALGVPVDGHYPLLLSVGKDVDYHYDVLLDGRKSTCECPGFERHGWHLDADGKPCSCKHLDGLNALVAAGKLALPASKPAPEAPALLPSCRCTVCHENLVDAEGGFDTCDECLSKQ
jgi:hypothetical protein